MWPFSSSTPLPASQQPAAAPSQCPVDHTTREAWLKEHGGQPPASHAATAPSAPPSTPLAPTHLSTDREISSIPRWRAPDPSASASGPPKEDEKWVYPSPSSFFSALARKNRAPNPDDMPVVVPIHNAVNERVWEQVLQWEREAGAKDSEVRLVSFVGRPKDFTPRARWRNLIGYTLPFDRHDWLVDRTVPSPPSADPSTPSEPSSIRIRYVIDFYTGRALPGSAPRSAPGSDERAVEDNFRPNLAFFLDVRPALDDMMGVGMRAKRFARRWGLAGDEVRQEQK